MANHSVSKRRIAERLTAGSAVPVAKQPRKRGRYRELDPAKLRTRLVKVYLTDAEYDQVQRHADKLAGTTVSNYGRQCILGTQLKSKSDLAVAAQLAQHFGLIRHLISGLDDIADVPTRKVALGELVELRDAVAASLIVLNDGYKAGKIERNGDGQ